MCKFPIAFPLFVSILPSQELILKRVGYPSFIQFLGNLCFPISSSKHFKNIVYNRRRPGIFDNMSFSLRILLISINRSRTNMQPFRTFVIQNTLNTL